MKRFSLTALAALSLGLGLSANAQEPAVVLTCGGVGLEESVPMRQAQSTHALVIVFSTDQGGYVSGVRTRIEPKGSQAVAQHEQCGPIAQVDVAKAGEYRVQAELDGVTREQTVRLSPRGGAHMVLRWPE